MSDLIYQHNVSKKEFQDHCCGCPELVVIPCEYDEQGRAEIECKVEHCEKISKKGDHKDVL